MMSRDANVGAAPTVVCLASNNEGKLREFRLLFAQLGSFRVVTLRDLGVESSPEESGDSFASNALIKARAAAMLTHTWVLADDSGLCVDALNGAPGVWSARFAGEHATDDKNNKLLLERLEPTAANNRGAEFLCALCLVDERGEVIAETQGVWRGTIACAARGHAGFGYDSVFIPDGDTRTAAELDPAEKGAKGHRARAIAALVDALQARRAIPSR